MANENKKNPREVAKDWASEVAPQSDNNDPMGVLSPAMSPSEVLKDFELGAKLVIMGEGQQFIATCIGKGTPVERSSPGKDPVTGLAIPGDKIDTWEFVNDRGIKFKVMEAHQLRSELPPLIGKRVIVQRQKDITSKGKRVTEYLVGEAK